MFDTDDPREYNSRKEWLIGSVGGANMKPGDIFLPAPLSSGMMALHGWEILEHHETADAYRLLAKYTEPEGFVCPECGTIGEYILFGTRRFEYHDIPSLGKQLHIIAIRQRRRCTACKATRFQTLPHMHPKHMMTQRLIAWIRLEAFEHTFTELGIKIGVTEATIRRVFGEYVKELEAEHERYTPEYLGIDELKIGKVFRGVITDVLNRRPIEFLKQRTEPTIVRFLNTLEKQNIRVVTMDMSGSYRPIIKKTLPHARIVVDKFHVIQLANTAMERARKSMHAKLEKNQVRQLKHDRRLLLLRRSQLDPSETLIVESWLNLREFAELGMAYQAKEAFCEIWNVGDRLRAESLYHQWVDELPEEMEVYFGGMIATIERWREEVFAYFDVGLTNAYTEAVNSIIRAAHRRGNGYSFEVLRAKLLFHPKRKRPGPPPTIYYSDEDRASVHGMYDHYTDEDQDWPDDEKQP
jgi:transposase